MENKPMTKKQFIELRESMQLTRMQLAEKLQLTRMTIFNYEYGKYPIPRSVEYALRYLYLELKK